MRWHVHASATLPSVADMSTFQRRYTDEQKRAVALAQLEHGMTAAEASLALQERRLTAAGAAPDRDNGPVSPPADRMPKTTAQDCARRVRLEREARKGGLEKADPAAARAELNRRLMVAADRLTRRLERQSRNGGKDAAFADILGKAARAVERVHAATRAAETSPPASPTPTATPSTEPAPSPLAALGREIAAAERKQVAADQ